MKSTISCRHAAHVAARAQFVAGPKRVSRCLFVLACVACFTLPDWSDKEAVFTSWRSWHSPRARTSLHAGGRSLWVGNLDWTTSKVDLWNHFKEIGDVVAAEVSLEKNATEGNRPRSRGWGNVVFKEAADAQQAVEKLHNSTLGSRQIAVRLEAAKLYVGNLAFRTRPSLLRRHFEAVGNVTWVDIKVVQGESIGGRPKSRGWGTVTMGSASEAEVALKLNNTELDGRKIIVKYA